MNAPKARPASRGGTPSLLAGARSVRDLGTRIRDSATRPNDPLAFAQYRQFLMPLLPWAHNVIQSTLHGTDFLVACRIKRIDSVRRKLQRVRQAKLERMDDIVGLRILVSSPEQQVTAAAALQQAFQGYLGTHSYKDYLDRSKITGYRAIHLIPADELQLPKADTPKRFGCEIQIRTHYQHLWSSTSESFGEQVKEGGGPPAVRSYLDELSNRIFDFEASEPTFGQIDPEPQSGELGYYLVVFDHQHRKLLDLQPLGTGGAKAVSALAYQETLAPDKIRREAALLGAASTEAQLKETHLRYFAPLGIPQLPDAIRPTQPRPIYGSR